MARWKVELLAPIHDAENRWMMRENVIEASEIRVDQDLLFLDVRGKIVAAYAPGQWGMVRRMEEEDHV